MATKYAIRRTDGRFLTRVEHDWTKTRGGTPLGDESLALVDHLERMAKIAGWMKS